MVCAELERLADWPPLDRAAQLKLLFTALFHDAGKPATTVLDPDTGRMLSPRHALVGNEIARRVLCELATSSRARKSSRSFFPRTSAVPAGEGEGGA